MIHVHALYSGASIAIPDSTLQNTISNESDSFNIFQDHFYNKLHVQRSKMLLKYTDHLHDEQGHFKALLHKNKPLRWF